jgi:hypothetical protein
MSPNAHLQPPRGSEATREPQAKLAAVGCKALLDSLLHGLRRINREALVTELRSRTNPLGGWHT